MSETKKIITHVAKSMDIPTKSLQNYENRYIISDGFTTIIAAPKEVDIIKWAEAHKTFVDTCWEIKKKTYKNDYEKLVVEKLQKCLRKPEIDIVYQKDFGGVDVVVFTDNIDALVREHEDLKE